jgi:hypothetical protein
LFASGSKSFDNRAVSDTFTYEMKNLLRNYNFQSGAMFIVGATTLGLGIDAMNAGLASFGIAWILLSLIRCVPAIRNIL